MQINEKIEAYRSLAVLLNKQSKIVTLMANNEDNPVWDSEWAYALQTEYNELSLQIGSLKSALGL